MKENFRPVAHHPPDTFFNKLKFWFRLLLDFQTLTIFKDLKSEMGGFKGKVLDIGCGNSPFEFLIDKSKAEYIGIDIETADAFDYKNTKIITFDGKKIPFEDQSIDNFICTEVIEHLEDAQSLIDEMHRILKENGKGIVTVPWSARVHFAPFDFCRFTPFKLKALFSKFREIEIKNRGTDFNSIVSKIIVLYLGEVLNWNFSLISIILIPLKLVLLIAMGPILAALVVFSHLALIFDFGSKNDPLGYTIILKK